MKQYAAELGFRTREMSIGTTRPVLIRFRLPPTFYASDGQHMDLVLNYAYAAGLAATSALVVQVNDMQVQIGSMQQQRKQRHAVRPAAHPHRPCARRDGRDGVGEFWLGLLIADPGHWFSRR